MANWYTNVVIYSLHLEAFRDGNGDGIGDLKGLRDSLDYLASLGITCLWLQPFYPSPQRDNGYDVTDYLAIDPRYGDLGDFVTLLEHAEQRNIRVLLDLPLNHTSIDHPWFQEARRDPSSRYRDFYYWSREEPKNLRDNPIFGEEQESNWTYDEEAGAWYYHTFYKHQPDLNYTNPAVLEEMEKVMGFWLRLGVAGFRLDAVPHMVRAKGSKRFDGDPHDVLRAIRRFVEEHRRDAVLLGEVDTEPDEYQNYFGQEDQLNVLLNFYLCNYLFLAFATRRSSALQHVLETLPVTLPYDQYGNFLRNHDELDLERLSEEDRQKVYEAYAPDEEMRAFGRGIRRRLAPMFEGDRRQIQMAHSLLFTMPGTPVVRYGDEIGMGDDLSLHGRDSVRTVMQWTDHDNAGFSTAPRERWARTLIDSGPFRNDKINVADQRRDPESLLHWFARAIHVRHELPEFGEGEPEVIETGCADVFAHLCRSGDSSALAVHNLSPETRRFRLDLGHEELDVALEMFADARYDRLDQNDGALELGPYGFRWFKLEHLLEG
ncbi:MAG TPA: alpha-amylase family protein [Trueperaceae bacterium]